MSVQGVATIVSSPDNEFHTFEKFKIEHPGALDWETEVEVKDKDGVISRGKFPMYAFGPEEFTIETEDNVSKKFNINEVTLKLIKQAPPSPYWARGGRKTRRRRHKKSHRRHKKSHRRHKKSHRR